MRRAIHVRKTRKRSGGAKKTGHAGTYFGGRHVGDGAVGLDCLELVQTPVQLLQGLQRHLGVGLIWKDTDTGLMAAPTHADNLNLGLAERSEKKKEEISIT